MLTIIPINGIHDQMHHGVICHSSQEHLSVLASFNGRILRTSRRAETLTSQGNCSSRLDGPIFPAAREPLRYRFEDDERTYLLRPLLH
jgi:hypothetical protein